MSSEFFLITSWNKSYNKLKCLGTLSLLTAMPDNKIAKPKTTEEVKEIILQSGTGFDAKYILGNVEKELNTLTLKNKKEVASNTFL